MKVLKLGAIALLATAISFGCDSQKASTESENDEEKMALHYPETRKTDTVDTYFGTQVPDPYRWLEDDRSEETGEWVEAQNAVTNAYLAKIPFRDKIKERMTELWNYPKYSAPFEEGGRYYFYKNDGLQNQSVLYVQESLEAEPKVFLDPNKLSSDGTAALGSLSFSKDSKYFAYGINRAGSDWMDIYLMDVESGKMLEDTLSWAKFTGMAWAGQGFYYSRYDAPEGKSELSSVNEYHKVYYHKVGEKQEKDRLVFEQKDHPKRYMFASTTEDERFLSINVSEGTSGEMLYVKDLKKGGDFVQLTSNFKADHSLVDNLGDELIIITNQDAPNKRLVKANISSPKIANWKDLIPETENVLKSVSLVGGKIFTVYMKDAYDQVKQHDLGGKVEKAIEMPGIGTVGGFGGNKDDKFLFYTFTSFTTPSNIYKYDIAAGQSELYRESEIDFDGSDYETMQVFYPSKDGTKIPMFIVYKKGTVLDGSNPTLLYAYGGFNISLNPGFSISRLGWLENGGIYAQANLRGGGEYGEDWHKAGMLGKKQNVFDDFIAAADYLVKEKYTSKEKLAIHGRSNGGLLVGAVMTQRPDLCAVALPGVGVMDMLRYHKFTVGWGWAVEYGSSEESKESFDNLYAFSPLHNIKEGVEYPATMVTTADHDDRVVPAHSFKFISELQAKHAGENPVLIRIDVDAGHGAGKPTDKVIQEWADVWAFTFYEMGVSF